MNVLCTSFLDISKKLRKVTICIIMSLSPSVYMEQLGSHWVDCNESWYLSIFQNPLEKNHVRLKWDKNKGYFTWRPVYIFIISCSVLFRMQNVLDGSCRENQNTHFMFNNFFWKLCRLWDNVEVCFRTRQATDDNMAHVLCMLDI
jgi:hypothetical protein